MDFRSCLASRKDLIVSDDSLDARLDASQRIIAAEPNPILLKDVSGMSVAANLFADRKAYAKDLSIPLDNFLKHLSDKLSSDHRVLNETDKIYGEEALGNVDLSAIPVLTHYSGDGGPYITSAVWIVNDPEYGRNLSYHRMMVTSDKEGTVRVVENRGMHQALQRCNGEAEVAICIGASPAVLLAGACSPADQIDEMHLAARLDDITLAKCKFIDVQVPADTEIVLEGRFTRRMSQEGPFVDITGTWDKVRQQPVIEILRIAFRENPIYHALIPGKAEHRILMGMPKELDIYAEVNEHCHCLDASVTEGGSAWLHAVVQIRKEKAADGRKALEAAFRAHKSLKHCVVVDEDINVHDMHQVEWAVATRFQADRDLIVTKDQPSSSLDPSANHEEGRKSRGSKMGLDATIKHFGERRKMFERIS
ncbi:MAG: UbiD family decarboxylase [candidate division KSB1 bacterium]|jgi:UbiD family decarboxylase|nr:UbiD family decarboxylase [candidate division KSB1 bacterium]